MIWCTDDDLDFSISSSSAEQTSLKAKMPVVRGPKRKAIEAELEMAKKNKVELQPNLGMVKQEKVEEVAKELLEENKTSYTCPVCSEELNCAPGDRVMKRHIMDEHFTPGSLLEMVGLDLEEGQKLR